MSNVAAIGHNQPPTALDLARQALPSITKWADENAVCLDAETASKHKEKADQVRLTIKDIDDERTSIVKPLNDRVKSINALYKEVSTELEALRTAIERPMKAFLRAEEDRRIREAEEARRKAEEAERLAREAEAREREAMQNAAQGDLDAAPATATIEADQAFSRFERSARDAQRAMRDAENVRIGGGIGRAASLRTVEELHVIDAVEAVREMFHDATLMDDIIKAARRFRKDRGRLPKGIEAEQVRK